MLRYFALPQFLPQIVTGTTWQRICEQGKTPLPALRCSPDIRSDLLSSDVSHATHKLWMVTNAGMLHSLALTASSNLKGSQVGLPRHLTFSPPPPPRLPLFQLPFIRLFCLCLLTAPSLSLRVTLCCDVGPFLALLTMLYSEPLTDCRLGPEGMGGATVSQSVHCKAKSAGVVGLGERGRAV